MKISFPEHFLFGTSTSAYQIETCVEHDWCNVKSRDGHTFFRTTDHEKRFDEDVSIIASLAPNYRMSLMWSKLQPKPFSELDKGAVEEYKKLLHALHAKGVNIMLVLHHFANAKWFAEHRGWEKRANIELWIDYAQKVVDVFGEYITSWNTFNEPNLYVSMGWCAGEFPPFRKNLFTAKRVLNNIAMAHNVMYDYIKSKYPKSPVGISHNCTVFAAENFLGVFPATFFDFCYMKYAPSLFTKTDFFGMSYYARIGHDPLPITYLTTPKKIEQLGKQHDDMWEYYPQGLKECILRYWSKYKKPIIITENGICTHDDEMRIRSMQDYMKLIKECIDNGVDVRGYYHWSAWDNFEWSLGPTYKFGLYDCDWETKERKRKPSADVFSNLAYNKEIEV